MEQQLRLGLQPRLGYAPEDFIQHAGVSNVFEECMAGFQLPGFTLSFITGRSRRGKTHLSITLADAAGRAGYLVRIWDGARFRQKLAEGDLSGAGRGGEVLIVDDVHLLLAELVPGTSGAFVAFIEGLRLRNAKVVLLSALESCELGCDEHVTSRLSPGTRHAIGVPSGSDTPLLLRQLARQRGMRLLESHLRYIERRVERDIAALEECLERIDHLGRVLGRPLNGSLVKMAVKGSSD